MFTKRGDTIIEVMIAIIVLGAALAGGFAVANKSQQNTQHSHERYQAQLLANQQAELLRSSFITHTKANDRDTFPSYTSGTGCFDSASGNWITSCVNGLYTISVVKVSDTAAGAPANFGSLQKLNYKISVTWDGLDGNQKNVSLLYGL
jgi:Tfp pilus assembly protein PilV